MGEQINEMDFFRLLNRRNDLSRGRGEFFFRFVYVNIFENQLVKIT